jgi:hypothetical protein
MKIISAIFLLFFNLFAQGKGVIYIGSTPANRVVKSFLAIPFSDSIDFIRWNLEIDDHKYQLSCNYGIGKPNTNGFMDGGKKIELTGKYRKEKNHYSLQNNNKTLVIAILNEHVLHLAEENKNLLIGNGGWSYTLSSQGSKLPIDIKLKPTALQDSMVFQGRTPCREIANLGLTLSQNCYKIKWSLILYASKGKPTTYRTRGTIIPETGKWKIKDGMILLESGEHPVYFIMADENILLFTDTKNGICSREMKTLDIL